MKCYKLNQPPLRRPAERSASIARSLCKSNRSSEGKRGRIGRIYMLEDRLRRFLPTKMLQQEINPRQMGIPRG